MRETITVGVVGVGVAGRAHLDALRSSSWAQATTVVDPDTERLRHVLDGAQDESLVSASWESLLASDVECVVIAVPPELHERLTIEALAAGKHVVCEKPLAPDVAACTRMIDAAHRHERVLLPVHNRIYMSDVEAVRALVSDGSIGEPFLVESHGIEGPELLDRIPWLRTDPGAGVLRSQAIHPAYVVQSLFGEVEWVSAAVSPRHVQGVAGEETALVTMQLTSGVMAHLTATFGLGRGPSDHSFTVYGSAGYVRTTWRGGRSERVVAAVGAQAADEPVEVELPDAGGPPAGFRRMWDDYGEAIRTGRPARVTAADGRAAVELVTAAHRSAHEAGRRVSFPF